MSTNSMYVVQVISLNDRIATIANEKTSPTRTHRFYEFREEIHDLPVVRLKIELPIYRIANYRTNILQISWLRKHNEERSDFFSSGQENESVQQLQHNFLWDLAQTEKESINSIIETLQNEQQKEPILITTTGVVVNGNRRLAAMRELKFTYVDCMVLPETATEDDLKDVEVRLQMTPETRLPYGWINECIAIKDLQERGRKPEKIADLMRLDVTKVNQRLLMLNEIELYLKDWRDAEKDYDQLTDAEEIISQFTKRVNKKEGIQQEISRTIGWILLDKRGTEGRIYDLRDVTGNLTQPTVEKLQEVFGSDIPTDVTPLNTQLELELDIEESSGPSEQNVLAFLRTIKGDEAKLQDVFEICRAVVETKKNSDLGSFALKSVRDAHTKLIEVDLTAADPKTYLPIQKQLDIIETRLSHLKTEISKYLEKVNRDNG
jgi:hypothetical protein